MLVDNVTITIKAGNGGDGNAKLKRNAQTPKAGPDGGNGGNGGNVFLQGSANVSDLSQFRFQKKLAADNGEDGRIKKQFGKNAKHLVIEVPLGTRITNLKSNEIYEIADNQTQLLIALGGIGGRGNDAFKSATNQAPTYAEKGGIGEEKELQLELQLIADIGLIGLPNAGKSSLLKVLTNAMPKIGAYAFTTLEPNLGVMPTPSGRGTVLADIPGLIEGASKGKGLGIQFLKHIKKTTLLVHCIDVTTPDILTSYEIVRDEFKKYDESLLSKPEVILLTKTDLATKEEIEQKINLLKKKNSEIKTISINNLEIVEEFKKYLMGKIKI